MFAYCHSNSAPSTPLQALQGGLTLSAFTNSKAIKSKSDVHRLLLLDHWSLTVYSMYFLSRFTHNIHESKCECPSTSHCCQGGTQQIPVMGSRSLIDLLMVMGHCRHAQGQGGDSFLEEEHRGRKQRIASGREADE